MLAENGWKIPDPTGFPARPGPTAEGRDHDVLERLRYRVRGWERRTRPVDPEFAAALARRWAELPEAVQTPGQVLGRFGPGCEGTHGVFPACNLACTPCYHSRDANRVRVDGEHTRARGRGADGGTAGAARAPRARAADRRRGDAAAARRPRRVLLIMRRYGREPMSMTHGDVDDDYLDRLVLGPDGRSRLDRRLVRRALRLADVRPARHPPPAGRGVAAPLPAPVRRAVAGGCAVSTGCARSWRTT